MDISLQQLADLVEASDGTYDPMLCDAIHDILPEPKCVQPPNYCASIDAAMLLVPEWYAVNSIRETTQTEQDENTSDEPLPLWSVALVRRDCTGYKNRKKFMIAFQHGDAATPALALCATAIRAQENNNG